jgi:hypothetical protein
MFYYQIYKMQMQIKIEVKKIKQLLSSHQVELRWEKSGNNIAMRFIFTSRSINQI